MIRGGYWGGSWGLSWAGAWGEAWLLLNQPYQELSLKGQVFVHSYLTSIHSLEVAEQIVSVAALNNLSVVDAEAVVAAKTGEARLEAVKKRTPSRVQPQEQVKQPERKKPLELAAKYSQQALPIEQSEKRISAVDTLNQLFVFSNAERADLVNHVNR